MAGKNPVLQKAEQMALPVLDALGYELVDAEYLKEGPNWYLRFYIDKPGGITIDDCQAASERITELLDQEDPIKTAYIFEVSSPGIDRPLKTERDFQRYMGEAVEVGLYAPREGQKLFEGTLSKKEDNLLEIIDEKGNPVAFNMKEIAVVKRAVRFN